MIVHIALFKWKEGVTEKRIEVLLKRVKSLESKVDGINRILAGKNYHRESKGLTHGVVVIARDKEALEAYRMHPDHKTVAKDIEAIEEDGIGFDFNDV